MLLLGIYIRRRKNLYLYSNLNKISIQNITNNPTYICKIKKVIIIRNKKKFSKGRY